MHDGDAEQVRSDLLKTLVDRTGADAYRAVLNLAAEEEFKALRSRLNELAHGKAEHDAEPPAWTPAEVLAFERRHVAPAKTGEALLQVVLSVLTNIQASFHSADASSRPLLERAEKESDVQEWLAEQMNLRSHRRFHAHREAQVARGDKPDIIVSSTAARVEVAVEVKHGGKKWSVRKLERSLTKQLAKDYLKPETRRHGVLVVSHHGRRTWHDPETQAVLYFHDVIKRLQALAKEVVRNDVGDVEVRVFGIDASRPEPPARNRVATTSS